MTVRETIRVRSAGKMDQVEGFKRYFMAVERDPLQRLEGPEVTPELFDKFLPYAVALDVEQAWSKRFAAALQRAGQAGCARLSRPVAGVRNRVDTCTRGIARCKRWVLRLWRRANKCRTQPTLAST